MIVKIVGWGHLISTGKKCEIKIKDGDLLKEWMEAKKQRTWGWTLHFTSVGCVNRWVPEYSIHRISFVTLMCTLGTRRIMIWVGNIGRADLFIVKGTFSQPAVSLIAVVLKHTQTPSSPCMTHSQGRMRLQSAATEHTGDVKGSLWARRSQKGSPTQRIKSVGRQTQRGGEQEQEIKMRGVANARIVGGREWGRDGCCPLTSDRNMGTKMFFPPWRKCQ